MTKLLYGKIWVTKNAGYKEAAPRRNPRAINLKVFSFINIRANTNRDVRTDPFFSGRPAAAGTNAAPFGASSVVVSTRDGEGSVRAAPAPWERDRLPGGFPVAPPRRKPGIYGGLA